MSFPLAVWVQTKIKSSDRSDIDWNMISVRERKVQNEIIETERTCDLSQRAGQRPLGRRLAGLRSLSFRIHSSTFAFPALLYFIWWFLRLIILFNYFQFIILFKIDHQTRRWTLIRCLLLSSGKERETNLLIKTRTRKRYIEICW